MAATGPLTSARCRLAATSAHVTGAAAACTDDASELRALHTADLHFDPASGRSVAELLPLILDAARDEGCSLLLLAGDVFDNGRVSEGEVLLFLSMLQAAGENDGLQAVLLPGNHDVDIFGASNSDAVRRAIPASVTLLASEGGDTVEVIVAGGQLVTVFGKPVFNHAPSFHPLGDLPPRPSTSDYHIVLGHGLVLDDGFGEGRSSPIAKSHLSGADCDYIALGHVHVFRDCTAAADDGLEEEDQRTLGPPAFYSGAPWDCGSPGCAIVTFRAGERAEVKQRQLPGNAWS